MQSVMLLRSYILDKNLIRALILSRGDATAFIESPISLVIAAFTLYALISRTSYFLAFKVKMKQFLFKK